MLFISDCFGSSRLLADWTVDVPEVRSLVQRSDLDVPLPDGVADEEYLAVVADHLPRVLADFQPDLVLYDAGVDPHKDDSLGR